MDMASWSSMTTGKYFQFYITIFYVCTQKIAKNFRFENPMNCAARKTCLSPSQIFKLSKFANRTYRRGFKSAERLSILWSS